MLAIPSWQCDLVFLGKRRNRVSEADDIVGVGQKEWQLQVYEQIGGSRVLRDRHDGRGNRAAQLLDVSMHDHHPTTICPVIFG